MGDDSVVGSGIVVDVEVQRLSNYVSYSIRWFHV